MSQQEGLRVPEKAHSSHPSERHGYESVLTPHETEVSILNPHAVLGVSMCHLVPRSHTGDGRRYMESMVSWLIDGQFLASDSVCNSLWVQLTAKINDSIGNTDWPLWMSLGFITSWVFYHKPRLSSCPKCVWQESVVWDPGLIFCVLFLV